MKLSRYLSLSVFLMGFSLLLAQPPQEVPSTLRVEAVHPSPESEVVALFIELPKNGEVENRNNVEAQIRVEGFALGTNSDLPREEEVANSTLGQTLHVFVDNEPYFAKTKEALDPFDEDSNYFESTLHFEIPFSLSEGAHILRVFPCRSFGESLKGKGCFASTLFYVKNKKANPSLIDLNDSMLLYNEPSGEFLLKEGDPILLDFYLVNCALSPDGYQVRIFLDGKDLRHLDRWTPHYLYGISRGSHTLRLELVDKNGKLTHPMNRIERDFTVE